MKEAPQRFTLVDEVEEKKAKQRIDDATRKRRSHLVWICIGAILLVMLLNGMGIIQTGHFERDPAQQAKELSDQQKEFWIEFHKTFGGE
jgi:flagellar basal body-associated protein FliL